MLKKIRITVIFYLITLLILMYPLSAYALGDYHYAFLYKNIPVEFNGQKSVLVLECKVYLFYDRIIYILPEEPVTVMLQSPNSTLVNVKLSARQKDDYTVTISGVVAIRSNHMFKNQYYYKNIDIYVDVK
ncbi:hypothetical protein [Thermosyntropha sp.]|uniref:hypothetical protein n=1 Tax=Thermosyntropha sp. TaxID=2740820 RepID=UPI0025E42ED7|nr:hypothetical protein [Thermosyntropha sp.]MBO8158195.1 hypothetical protein [Thermosyntropha sp.]